jgi:CheY-like chemotaxis protein
MAQAASMNALEEKMNQQILLIDDYEAMHPLLKSLLGPEAMTVHSAFDGQNGLLLAASLAPDLILLDVMMPGIDGYETYRQLKADPVTAGIPVIFMTAVNETVDMGAEGDSGTTGFLAKPFTIAELLSCIHIALPSSHPA